MMLSRKWTLAAVAAMVIAVAGCSSSGDKKVADTTPDPKPAVSTAQAQIEARVALANAKSATDDAVEVATAAAGTAAEAAAAAAEALTKAEAARTDVTGAEAAKTAAEKAKTEADDAKTAADTAAADVAAIDDGKIGTEAGAAAMKEAADKAKAAADAAGKAAETAKMAAANAQEAAKTAAGMHVLALFRAANAYGVTAEATGDKTAAEATADARKQTAARIGDAMASAAKAEDQESDDNQTPGTSVSVSAAWPADTPDNPDTKNTNEFEAGKLSVTVTGLGDKDIQSDTMGADANKDGDFEDDGDTKPNARKIDGLGDFTHGFDIEADSRRVIVFTDKMQGNPAVKEVTAATARSVNGQAVEPGELGKVTSTANTITGVEWTPTDEAPLTGTLSCTGDSCSITLGNDGAVTAITGYTFAGSRAARKAVTAAGPTENNNYLLFGIWLDAGDAGVEEFGAFASGGADYAVAVADAVTGTATYRGKAAGAHHKTGMDVNWFDGDARLTAEFGDKPETGPDNEAGTISGEISNIRVDGGAAMSESIILTDASLTDRGSPGFSSKAVMGDQKAPGSAMHEYNGMWRGSFYGGTEGDDSTADMNALVAPKAVAGTFGVTKMSGTGDDAVTESFVGAFGAHKE